MGITYTTQMPEMDFDLGEISSFLGVEGQSETARAECILFELIRPSDRLLLTIIPARSEVGIELRAADSTSTFVARFKCDSISVYKEHPRKMTPALELVIADSAIDEHSFFLQGPPDYECDFLYTDMSG